MGKQSAFNHRVPFWPIYVQRRRGEQRQSSFDSRPLHRRWNAVIIDAQPLQLRSFNGINVLDSFPRNTPRNARFERVAISHWNIVVLRGFLRGSCADFVEAAGFHRDRHLSTMNTRPGKLKLYEEEECLDCTSKVIERTNWNFYANYERLNFSFRNDCWMFEIIARTGNKIVSEFWTITMNERYIWWIFGSIQIFVGSS